jgi:hypothetical protein
MATGPTAMFRTTSPIIQRSLIQRIIQQCEENPMFCPAALNWHGYDPFDTGDAGMGNGGTGLGDSGGGSASPASTEPGSTTITVPDTATPKITDTNPTVEPAMPEVATIGSSERVVVIDEDMGRVSQFASDNGYETMPTLPEDMSYSDKMSANRAWINGCMDEGCTIVDIGPAPNNPRYPGYPYISSPFYAMEQADLAGRNYLRWIIMWGVVE